MLQFSSSDSSLTLRGPSGSIQVPSDDEITRKIAMLIDGQCQGLGPTAAARKFGYTKSRYFQLVEAYREGGAEALKSKTRGPKTRYRRTGELIRLIIRHRFLDPEASVEVIAQKLKQTGYRISIRSVERVISDFGLQKKTLCAGGQRSAGDGGNPAHEPPGSARAGG
jgi:transposase